MLGWYGASARAVEGQPPAVARDYSELGAREVRAQALEQNLEHTGVAQVVKIVAAVLYKNPQPITPETERRTDGGRQPRCVFLRRAASVESTGELAGQNLTSTVSAS
jgi:hypothetical protein